MPTTATSRGPEIRHAISHPVVAIGLGLVALQVLLRAWATYNGWFYADDFEFLYEATGQPLSLDLLMRPHDSQFMPGGRLAAWLVAQAGPFNWPLAASIILALQVLASTACLFMLRVLFGPRPWILIPLAFYLFTPMTITAYMWWAAAINHVPLQLAFFLIVAWHVVYLRSKRTRFAIIATLSLALGLVFYVKTLLIVGPLLLLTATYFTRPEAKTLVRALSTVRDWWRIWVLYLGIIILYLSYYLTQVPSPLSPEGDIDYGGLLDTMMRVSLASAALGGPWKWSLENPPLGQVDTPDLVVTACWILIVSWVASRIRRHPHHVGAVLIALTYLAISFLLVAQGRGASLGSFAGLELRYLADAAPIITLAVALLASGSWRGVTSASSGTTPPVLQRGNLAPLVLVPALTAGALYSTITYANFWSEYPAKTFAQNVITQSSENQLVIADETVPELVMSVTSYPSNLPSRLFAPLGDRVKPLEIGNDLAHLTPQGEAVPATISGGARSTRGPTRGCGHLIQRNPEPIHMDGDLEDYFWWMEVAYMSGGAGQMHIQYGDQVATVDVQDGLHRAFIKGEGSIQPLSLRSSGSLTLCVDSVTVGRLEAGYRQ